MFCVGMSYRLESGRGKVHFWSSRPGQRAGGSPWFGRPGFETFSRATTRDKGPNCGLAKLA